MENKRLIKRYYIFDEGERAIHHPGLSLYNYIRCADMSYKEFARLANMPKKTVRHLCKGKIDVTPDIADRLADVIGGTARNWLDAQEAWDEV